VDVAVRGQLLLGVPAQHRVEHGPATSRGTLDALLAAADLIDGRVRTLPGLGHHARFPDAEELPLVGELLFRPGAGHDVHRFVEALAILLLGDVVAAEFGGTVPAAHANVEPALGDDVDER